MKRNLILLSGLAFALFSCNDKDEPATPSLPYDNGVIVVNEGNFMDNNGTVNLLQRESSTISLNIFEKENSKKIDGGVSGYSEVNGKGIILVDNSTAGQDLIEIVDARTFKSIATIPSSEIENPREVAKVSETKAYVTAWDATGAWPNTYINPGYVAVLDLNTNKLTKKIPVQHGAQSIVVVGSEAFVGNTFSGKTVISVIDIPTDAVKQTIEVGADPNIIGLDANNKLWIYADGSLKKINPASKVVENSVTLTPLTPAQSANKFTLSADKKTLYYSLSTYDTSFNEIGQIYSASVDANAIAPTTPIINKTFIGSAISLAIDPETSQFYCGLTPSYKQAGYVFRYQANGTLIDSVKAEIAPAKFFFKN